MENSEEIKQQQSLVSYDDIDDIKGTDSEISNNSSFELGDADSDDSIQNIISEPLPSLKTRVVVTSYTQSHKGKYICAFVGGFILGGSLPAASHVGCIGLEIAFVSSEMAIGPLIGVVLGYAIVGGVSFLLLVMLIAYWKDLDRGRIRAFECEYDILAIAKDICKKRNIDIDQQKHITARWNKITEQQWRHLFQFGKMSKLRVQQKRCLKALSLGILSHEYKQQREQLMVQEMEYVHQLVLRVIIEGYNSAKQEKENIASGVKTYKMDNLPDTDFSFSQVDLASTT